MRYSFLCAVRMFPILQLPVLPQMHTLPLGIGPAPACRHFMDAAEYAIARRAPRANQHQLCDRIHINPRVDIGMGKQGLDL